MKQIPNVVTLFNLFFGCIAIVFALQTESILISEESGVSTFNFPEKLAWSGIFIGIAAVVDFLDGFVARLFKATSEMGKQLDSLADVVSFGVAPGVILYQLLRMSYAREAHALDASMILMVPAFIYSCAAAYRLAKFNLDPTQSYDFKGLPTPAAGLLIASFPLILHFNPQLFGIGLVIINKFFLYAVIIMLSLLMLSNLRIMGMKFKNYTLKDNLPKIILIVAAILFAIFLQWLAVPAIFLFYILLSLVSKKRNNELSN